MKAKISLLAIGLIFFCYMGCQYTEADQRRAEIISDSIRIQDSLQIQLWLDSLSADTDSLQKVMNGQ